MKTLIPFPPLQKSLIIRKMLTPIHAASSLLLMVFLSSSFNAEAIPPGISIDKKSYPVTGIDISQYVGPVDFKQVKKNREEVDFVYMRATLGTSKTDTKFETYYTDAKRRNCQLVSITSSNSGKVDLHRQTTSLKRSRERILSCHWYWT